ncbi:asparagine synthase (glutamine-hydrolyzing) [Amycolatopsis roodepoortensis]|uniref:asparagine synthase (glutamine-hydrolyzing) n=1 Tax=Amycolatopsis roodepoortensis TaxID=700274 RepID=UPI00214C5A2A|nr:asparagine synthase (glutamine-hydrolyzing) [Amycolatopsis roodepoortensis]UUV31543.1 asparagine synthase (glutamine-hydrolyzing) [Amycolatopsis roodepoortensis]
MSGIAGWLDWQRDLTTELPTIRAMTTTMTNRGPDDGGVWTSRHAALGHRRLAVIDVSGGTQPMLDGDEDSHTVLSFSGEIYNYRELRAELRGRGQVFRTDSDAEVLLRAYREWGEECVTRLYGVFAFAIWDERERTLLLGRDRLGVKPLYYAEYDGGLLFGSEPKAVLANPLFEPVVDAEGLVDVFVVAAKRPGDAVFRGLREVRPGYTVRVTPDGTRQRRYWSLRSAEHEENLADTTAKVRELLETVVREQLVSEAPFGALLSGGLDSSVLCALAAADPDGTGPLETYSVDFADSETDFTADALHISRDAPYVSAVVAHLGTKHTEVVLDAPALLEEMGTTLRARDIPGVGDLDVSLYLLFQEVRKHATVVFSGEGSDDIFGGFPWFTAVSPEPATSFPWSAGVGDRNAVLSADLRAHLDLNSAVLERYAEALREVPRLDGESAAGRRMREMFYVQLTRFLPFLLDRKDRMSMASGLEVRVPFCDHRLVEYLWNVPWSQKYTGQQEKGLLRDAVADLLPEDVVRRKKSGFPFGQNPEYLLAVRDGVRDMLSDSTSPARQLFDEGTLRAMVDSDAWSNGTYSPPPVLPRALLLDAWLRQYRIAVRP